jgi:hypothetical protein
VSRRDIIGRDNVRVGSQTLLPAEPEVMRACPITRQDLDILLEGSGAGHNRAVRDLMIGIFVSSFTGLIGLVSALPDDMSKVTKANMTFLVLLSSATLGSAFIGVLSWIKAVKEEGRASFKRCKERIERTLGTENQSQGTPPSSVVPPQSS